MFGGILDSRKEKVARNWTRTTLCAKYVEVKYSGNTTNLRSHLIRHHPEHAQQPGYANRSLALTQPTLEKAFGTKFPSTSLRAEKITSALASFICKDLRPYSVVENVGFRHFVHTLEPHYVIPTRKQLSHVTIPKMYADVKNNIATALKSAERVAVTCDSWTSRATDSYLTITCHYIDGNWCLVSHVIQTQAIEASHTATHLAELLTEVLREWELTDRVPAAVTDNAANIVRAMASMGLLHVGCFAHTLNLASQAALKIPSVARLMGRVRRIAAFFHRSTTVSHMLKEKQKLLNLCQHKLVIDVVTCWNSSLDMLERFLEKQPAITGEYTITNLCLCYPF
ncbi:E3 SUMO-protein ligase ZBED1-like [Acanthochromis polyacanthus]|uniref:E3 SUMO-protein ligase ZBED1-like n=1 Tax=Acanthochromis polyacanthus TaxID=80966 RepID=UPI0022340177|nr:E3 SUMO-protein ligase ZBED1-like [Acanthochromis polyacanthus]